LEHTALELIDQLIACWCDWDSHERDYLDVVAPSIVRSDDFSQLLPKEKVIVTALRRLLSEREWPQLPTLIAQRRANRLKELASDRERAQAREEARRRKDEECAQRKEEEARKQLEIERERRRQEQEQREAEEAQIARKRALVARLKDVFKFHFLSVD
jgi:ATPase subunit of ABC transporter with duplicated ATPase domains